MGDQALAALRELTEAVMAEFFGNDTNLSKRLIKATNDAQLLLMVQPPDDDRANRPAPVEPAAFALQWSENRPPCEECRFDHCTAETPFGSFLITWKSWKEYDSPTVDETPWGDFWQAFATVELAKAACQREFDTRLALCGLNRPAPAEPTELTDQELLRTYNEELVQTYNARNYINEERVRAATIAGLRAVIAADRARRAAPPAEGEAGKLAEWMGDHAAHLRTMEEIGALPQTELPARLHRAADLLQQQAAELATLRQLARPVAIPGEAYHDDMGPVTWWRFPVGEAPWVGTPGDSDWPGYHTHFSPCPLVPAPPEDRPHD